MSAQAFKIYNKSKKQLGAGALKLTGNFRISLYTSASNAATLTLGTRTSVTTEVTEANGYSSSGKPLSSTTWTVGASAKQYAFAAGSNPFWSANGGSIANIKFAVIWASGASATVQFLLCFASLTSSQFSLAAGNRLTLAMPAGGILTLV